MSTPRTGRHFAPSAGEGEQGAARAHRAPEMSAGAHGEENAPLVAGPGEVPPASVPPVASEGRGSGAPINPLVAAREAGAARAEASAPRAADELFDMNSVAPAAAAEGTGKSFDTSFSDGHNVKRTVVIVLIVVVVLAALVVGGFFFVRGQAQAKATNNITAAIQRVSDADVVITPLDAAIGSEISSETVSQALTDAMLSSTTASNALTDADSRVRDANDQRALLTEEQTTVIDALKGSISARRSMLEIGRTLLASDAKVLKALENLDAAYASIEAANGKVKQSEDAYTAYADAVAQDGDLSVFDLWATVDVDNQAVADITNAQASVAAAKEQFPDADYSGIENYLNARLAELNVMVAFDTAVANGDQDGANGMIDQLNQAAAASEQAASSVPGTSRDLVRAAYSVVTSSQSEQYDVARDACAENDAIIREYLGTDDLDGATPGMDASSTQDATPTLDTPSATSDPAPTDAANKDAAAA